MKKFFAAVMVGLMSLTLYTNAFAADSSENGVTSFFRRLFNYPVKAAKGTGEDVANTANNVGDKVLSKTGENIAKGDVGGVVAQPVVGTAQTVGQTASETVQMPVKAAEEDKKTE